MFANHLPPANPLPAVLTKHSRDSGNVAIPWNDRHRWSLAKLRLILLLSWRLSGMQMYYAHAHTSPASAVIHARHNGTYVAYKITIKQNIVVGGTLRYVSVTDLSSCLSDLARSSSDSWPSGASWRNLSRYRIKYPP